MTLKRSLHFILTPFLLLPFSGPFAQGLAYDSVVAEYIERFKYIAIQEMKDYGIPASITLAQGILESNAGRSDLAVKANNHFGIKCHKEWTGPSFYQDDDQPNECFRKYNDPVDSYRDHSLFLTTRDRYKPLFTLRPDDYTSWAEGLKTAGYATNPKYPELLIRTIERFSLHQYDRGEAGLKPLPAAATPAETPVFRNMKYSYFAPGPDGRKTYTNNHTLLVIAARDEKLEDISAAFGIPVRKLLLFNDLKSSESIREGIPVYLAKKQGKGGVKSHKVAKGQSMWEISQIYAVQLMKLSRRNGMTPGQDPVAGQVLKLR
jgi:LysM repeat protein